MSPARLYLTMWYAGHDPIVTFAAVTRDGGWSVDGKVIPLADAHLRSTWPVPFLHHRQPE